MSGRRWAETLVSLWEANIPAFAAFAQRLRAGEEMLYRLDPSEIARLRVGERREAMPAMHRCDWEWFLQRVVADRFAVREADEIERAECSLMPWRFELWLKYQVGIAKKSLTEIARERGVPVPVLAFYAWRFGMVRRWRCGWSWRDWFEKAVWRTAWQRSGFSSSTKTATSL